MPCSLMLWSTHTDRPLNLSYLLSPVSRSRWFLISVTDLTAARAVAGAMWTPLFCHLMAAGLIAARGVVVNFYLPEHSS